MFKVEVDSRRISLRLRRRHFILLKVDGYDVYVDSGKETQITVLSEELQKPEELRRLTRYAIFQNDIELTPLSLARNNSMGQITNKPTYAGKVVICKSYELIPSTSDVWISFNPVRKLQIEEFVYFLSVADQNL